MYSSSTEMDFHRECGTEPANNNPHKQVFFLYKRQSLRMKTIKNIFCQVSVWYEGSGPEILETILKTGGIFYLSFIVILVHFATCLVYSTRYFLSIWD